MTGPDSLDLNLEAMQEAIEKAKAAEQEAAQKLRDAMEEDK